LLTLGEDGGESLDLLLIVGFDDAAFIVWSREKLSFGKYSLLSCGVAETRGLEL
jgi:hypothetical protein